MKRYVFSLNRVLRVRETQESIARQALRAAAEHAAQADDDYDMKSRSYEANVASAASLRGTVLNMLAMRDVITRRAQAVVDAKRESELAHAEAEAAHEAWAEAKRKLGVLEHLDDRQRAEHQARELAKEQAEVDDLAGSRAQRARSTSTSDSRKEVPR